MINLKLHTKKHFSNLSFAVIGAGPAGMYTAKHILTAYKNSTIDFYDKIPHPYGLIRTGIAPDHQNMKKAEKEMKEQFESKNVRFMGNVEVGKDIPFEVLRQNYSSIILSYGADSENNLGINNEFSFGCFSARTFVQWYNGHVFYSRKAPFFTDKFDLRNAKDVVIIGNGNVAVDIARILAKNVDSLKQYDIAEPILEVLSTSGVQKIHMVARRGVMDAAFTTKEIRELSNIARVNVFKDELEASLSTYEDDLKKISPVQRRQVSRKIDLIKSFNIIDKNDLSLIKPDSSQGRNIYLRFLLKPREIFVTGEGDNARVKGISFSRTGKDESIEAEVIDTPLIFKSIGYKSIKLFEEIAFDNKRSIIVNKDGVVFDSNMNPCKNIFTTGWVKTGPRGILDSTIRDSELTVESVFQAIKQNLLEPKTPDYEYIISIAKSKGKVPISFEDWQKIDAYEISEGEKRGKLREKILDLETMLSLIKH